MPFVLKIKFGNTLRRVIVQEAKKDGKPDITFKCLEAKVREMFQISQSGMLVMTYIDEDNEIVTMGDDSDLHDACIVQRLDPLRIEVNATSMKPDGTEHKEILPAKSSMLQSIVDLMQEAQNTTAVPIKLLCNVPKDKETSSNCEKVMQCTGCGIMPVFGLHYKSQKREGDDLCRKCLTGQFTESKYDRVDQRIHSSREHFHHRGRRTRHGCSPPPPLRTTHHPHRTPAWHPPPLPLNRGSHHHRHKKLDSRFIQHLTFFDGSQVPAGTTFTKSWRLQNIGISPWPSQTQLVCVGGHVLGSERPSPLKTPKHGLLSSEEIDASVDLVAPQCPGRYISFWRLMAPSGQKFGQRLWVSIQAIPEPVKTGESSGLEAPIQSDIVKDCKHLEAQTRSLETMEGTSSGDEVNVDTGPFLTTTKIGDTSLSDSLIDDGSSSEARLACSMQSLTKLVSELDSVKSEVEGFSLVEKPCEGSRDLEASQPLAGRPAHNSAMPGNVLEECGFSDCQEDIILGMLNSMGFTQRTLNLELLRKNKHDMQGTGGDLVAASDWDPILDDLEEMGFHDSKVNRRLLCENNGSVKLVVKELLQMQTLWGLK